MPRTFQITDEETQQPLTITWDGPEGTLPSRRELDLLIAKARATAPPPPKSPFARVIDLSRELLSNGLPRELSADLESTRRQYPAFGGELWAARKAAEASGALLAKVRRPVDIGIGLTLRAAAQRSKAKLAAMTPEQRAAFDERFDSGSAADQEAANERRLASAERLISGGATLGSEERAALGPDRTKAGAVGSTLLTAATDFSSDPANLAIGGLSSLGRLGAQLQYVLGAALSGAAGMGAVRKAGEVGKLAAEGKLNSPQAAAAATEAVLDTLMAGFGARGVMKGLSRDQVLGELEKSAKENAMLESTGIGQTPPEIQGAVAQLKPYAEAMVKRRAEFTGNVRELRKEQQAALKEAMAKLEADPNDASAQAVFDSLAGGAARPEALPPETAIAPEAEAALKSWVGKYGKRDPYTATHALEGLQALLTGAGRDGRPLEHSRKIALLKVFGRDLYKITNAADAAIQATPLWEKVKAGATDILIDAPRALQASADLTATFRQGSIPTTYNLITHPIRTVKDVAQAAFAFNDPKVYHAAEKQLRNNTYVYTDSKSQRSQVNLSKLGEEFGLNRLTDSSMERPAGGDLTTSDYFTPDSVVEKVPVVGEVVKGSERSYKLYMDTVRHRLWREWDEHLRDLGYTPEKNPQFWKDSAEAINELTGIADLPHIKAGKIDLDFNQAGPLLRAVFFAPRFAYARLKLLGDIATAGARYQSKDAKTFFTKMEPVNPVRTQMLKILGSYGAFYGSLLYTITRLVAGATVEKDPRSADGAKVKIGNTRFDVWGGLQQPARLLAQAITGERKSTSTGKVRSIPGSPGDYAKRAKYRFETGEDLPPDTDQFSSDFTKVMQEFIESKASPLVSYARDIGRGGEDMYGKPADLNPLTRFRPFGFRDVEDAYAQDPALAAIVAPLGALGIGTQTYAPDSKEQAAVKEVKALREEQTPAKPPEPDAKVKRELAKDVRAEHELKIRRALKAGDRIAAYDAWLEAKLNGYPFPDLKKQIMQGYDTPDDEEN